MQHFPWAALSQAASGSCTTVILDGDISLPYLYNFIKKKTVKKIIATFFRGKLYYFLSRLDQKELKKLHIRAYDLDQASAKLLGNNYTNENIHLKCVVVYDNNDDVMDMLITSSNVNNPNKLCEKKEVRQKNSAIRLISKVPGDINQMATDYLNSSLKLDDEAEKWCAEYREHFIQPKKEQKKGRSPCRCPRCEQMLGNPTALYHHFHWNCPQHPNPEKFNCRFQPVGKQKPCQGSFNDPYHRYNHEQLSHNLFYCHDSKCDVVDDETGRKKTFENTDALNLHMRLNDCMNIYGEPSQADVKMTDF